MQFLLIIVVLWYLLLPRRRAEYCDKPVCLSVRPRAYLWSRWTDLHEILCADLLWPWLGPPLAALRYVMYFRLLWMTSRSVVVGRMRNVQAEPLRVYDYQVCRCETGVESDVYECLVFMCIGWCRCRFIPAFVSCWHILFLYYLLLRLYLFARVTNKFVCLLVCLVVKKSWNFHWYNDGIGKSCRTASRNVWMRKLDNDEEWGRKEKCIRNASTPADFKDLMDCKNKPKMGTEDNRSKEKIVSGCSSGGSCHICRRCTGLESTPLHLFVTRTVSQLLSVTSKLYYLLRRMV